MSNSRLCFPSNAPFFPSFSTDKARALADRSTLPVPVPPAPRLSRSLLSNSSLTLSAAVFPSAPCPPKTNSLVEPNAFCPACCEPKVNSGAAVGRGEPKTNAGVVGGGVAGARRATSVVLAGMGWELGVSESTNRIAGGRGESMGAGSSRESESEGLRRSGWNFEARVLRPLRIEVLAERRVEEREWEEEDWEMDLESESARWLAVRLVRDGEGRTLSSELGERAYI